MRTSLRAVGQRFCLLSGASACVARLRVVEARPRLWRVHPRLLVATSSGAHIRIGCAQLRGGGARPHRPWADTAVVLSGCTFGGFASGSEGKEGRFTLAVCGHVGGARPEVSS